MQHYLICASDVLGLEFCQALGELRGTKHIAPGRPVTGRTSVLMMF